MKYYDHPLFHSYPSACLGLATAVAALCAYTPTLQAQTEFRYTSGTHELTGEEYPDPIVFVRAHNGGSPESAPNIVVNASGITFANPASDATNFGMSGRGADFNLTDVTISTGGSYAVGIEMSGGDGWHNNLDATGLDITVSAIAIRGVQSAAVNLAGLHSGVVRNSVFRVSNDWSHGAFISGGANFQIENTDITVNGAESSGLYSYGGGGGTLLTANSIDIQALGAERNYGIYTAASASSASEGGHGRLDGTDITVSTVGTHSYGLYSRRGGVLELSDSTVTTSGAFAHGAYVGEVTEAGLGNTSIHLQNVDITTTGADANAVHAEDAGLITVQGGSLNTTGARAHGLYAANAGSEISVKDLSVTTTNKNSKAAFAEDGGTITIQNSNLNSSNSGHGLHAIDAGSMISVEGSSITTDLSSARAVFAEDGASIVITDSVINANTTGGLLGAVHANNASIQLIGSTLVNHSMNPTSGRIRGQGVVAFGSEGHVTIHDSDITVYGTSTSRADPSRAIFAHNGGKFDLDNVVIRTEGEFSAAIGTAGGLGEVILGSDITANTYGTQSHGIHTYGAAAASEEASSLVNLSNVDIHTRGESAHGVLAVLHGSETVLDRFSIKTEGSGANGISAERGGNVTLRNGTIDAAGAGVLIGSDRGPGNSSVHLENVQLAAQESSLKAYFGEEAGNNEAATFLIEGNSSLTANNGTLLAVDRDAAPEGATGQDVNVTFGSGVVASGDILDTSEHKGSNKLNITIAAGAKVTSNVIAGYNNLTVDGKLDRSNASASLIVGTDQSLSGGGTVAHDVTVDGGSLDTQTRILGNLDLGETNKDRLTLPESGTLTVDAGRQGVIDAVDNADAIVDATAGAAEIASFSAGTVKTGNWGATISEMSGGTVDATAGVARVESFNSGTINMGTGGAAVTNFAGGSAVGSSSAADTELTVNNITGGLVSKARLTIANDGTPQGTGGELALNEAQLGGNGIVNASVVLENSNINAGNSVGRLDFSGGLDVGTGSSYTFEINDATGIAGETSGGWDLITAVGPISFAPDATFKITSLNHENLAGEAMSFDDLTDYNWLVAISETEITGWDTLLIDTSEFLNAYTGTFGLDVAQNGSGNYELYLQYTAVPEPTTVALILSGCALGAVAMQRRRRNSRA